MRLEEKRRACELRGLGWSYNDILKEVGVSKSTLSLWLRDIPLSDQQIAALECKFKAGREKFIHKMRVRRDNRWAQYHREAEEEYAALSRDPAFMFGLALYVGEGSKTEQNKLCFSNCDPRVIQKALEFFLKIGVPLQSIRCAVHVHPGMCMGTVEEFWRGMTGLPAEQFHRTLVAVSRASSGRKINIQQYGTCHIIANHTKIRQKLAKWMEISLSDGPLV